jgi:aminoglycoside phosphotransferase (APT) family kinase protein
MIDPTADIFGWSYAIMPRLPWMNIADREVRKSFSMQDREQHASAMGGMLAELHSLTFDAPGVYDTDSDAFVPLPLAYDEWFANNTRTWLERSRHASKATTDADVAWVESIIASSMTALRVPFAPVLVHDDYTETNVVMLREDSGWRITGVLDLMTAQAGDGEADLARSLCAYTFEDARLGELYLSAYTSRRPLREGWRERMRLYVLTDRLVFWEYGQRNKRWFDPGTHLREWAEPFVEMDIRGANTT